MIIYKACPLCKLRLIVEVNTTTNMSLNHILLIKEEEKWIR